MWVIYGCISAPYTYIFIVKATVENERPDNVSNRELLKISTYQNKMVLNPMITRRRDVTFSDDKPNIRYHQFTLESKDVSDISAMKNKLQKIYPFNDHIMKYEFHNLSPLTII